MRPLSSEYGAHKTVKARFWPWLSGRMHFKFFPLHSEADTLRQPKPHWALSVLGGVREGMAPQQRKYVSCIRCIRKNPTAHFRGLNHEGRGRVPQLKRCRPFRRKSMIRQATSCCTPLGPCVRSSPSPRSCSGCRLMLQGDNTHYSLNVQEVRKKRKVTGSILHPKHHTLYSTSYCLHFTLCTPHRTPYTLHPAPYPQKFSCEVTCFGLAASKKANGEPRQCEGLSVRGVAVRVLTDVIDCERECVRSSPLSRLKGMRHPK